ncbi:hypothetical protein [Micromonospora carbonacea]|uniref:hypothetical protein n=1 Tax=Micromonospora carbonacea TaxID=47853 RepID=UPI0037139C1C
MEILFWICVLTWFFQRAATDVLYAAAGKPNPRYELKKQKAIAAGQPPAAQPRYGTRDWFGDLWSDALAANTEKRRAGKTKAKPVDDMLDVAKVRPEPGKPSAAEKPEPAARADDAEGISVVHDDQHPYCTESCGPNCGQYGWSCNRCGARQDGFVTLADARAASWHECRPAEQKTDPAPAAAEKPATPTGEPSKLATVIPMFPIMKEPTMSNAEITGLPTAIIFAQGMANAHKAAAAAGGEQYVAALRGFDVGDGAIATVTHAREMSAQAAAAWDAAAAEMQKQNTVKEAYQAVPDAGNKRFVTGE